MQTRKQSKRCLKNWRQHFVQSAIVFSPTWRNYYYSSLRYWLIPRFLCLCTFSSVNEQTKIVALLYKINCTSFLVIIQLWLSQKRVAFIRLLLSLTVKALPLYMLLESVVSSGTCRNPHVNNEALHVSTYRYILILCILTMNQRAVKNSVKKCHFLFITRSRAIIKKKKKPTNYVFIL